MRNKFLGLVLTGLLLFPMLSLASTPRPAFFDDIKSQADMQKLSDVQKAELKAYLSAAALENTNATLNVDLSDISLDKTAYLKGDMIEISPVITSEALQAYINSHKEQQSDLQLSAFFEIKDSMGVSCTGQIEKKFSISDLNPTFSAKALVDCNKPVATIKLSDWKGKQLGAWTIKKPTIIESTTIPASMAEKSKGDFFGSKFGVIFSIVFAIFVLLIAGFVLWRMGILKKILGRFLVLFVFFVVTSINFIAFARAETVDITMFKASPDTIQLGGGSELQWNAEKGSLYHVGTITPMDDAKDVKIKGNYAYVTTSDGIKINDITDKRNPVYLKTITATPRPTLPRNTHIDYYTLEMDSSERYLYVGFTDQYNNIEIFDLSDSRNPVSVNVLYGNGDDVLSGKKGFLGGPIDSLISGSYLYVLTTDGLWVYDIADRINIKRVASILTANDQSLTDAYFMSKYENYIYITKTGGTKNAQKGITVINVSNPGSPSVVRTLYSSDDYKGIDVNVVYSVNGKIKAAYLYATVRGDGGALKIFDIFADPSSPSEISSVSSSDSAGVYYPGRVVVSGGYAYVVTFSGFEGQPQPAGAERIGIFDVANPAKPILKGLMYGSPTVQYLDSKWYYQISQKDGYVYIPGYATALVGIVKYPALENSGDVSCRVADDRGNIWNNLNPAGKLSVFPLQKTKYTLNCSAGEANDVAYQTIYVNVPPRLDFSVTLTDVVSGGATELTWSVTGAASCTASGDWSGSKSILGGTESTGALTAKKTYSLTCTGSGGSVTKSVDVNILAVNTSPKPTLTFYTSAPNIESGTSSDLWWWTTDAAFCTASNGWTGEVATSGSLPVFPSTTTTYTLVCAGPGGVTDPQNVTITVNSSAVPVAACDPLNVCRVSNNGSLTACSDGTLGKKESNFQNSPSFTEPICNSTNCGTKPPKVCSCVRSDLNGCFQDETCNASDVCPANPAENPLSTSVCRACAGGGNTWTEVTPE